MAEYLQSESFAEGLKTPSTRSESGGLPGHSNLYVKNLAPEVDEATLQSIFEQFGICQSVRIVKNSRTQTSKGYGFVKLSNQLEAAEAVKQMNGANLGNSILEVKFADADAGPPLTSTGTTPSDNLYCRNLPCAWGDKDLMAVFAPYGNVQECRVLHSGDMARGAGALVRLSSVEEAARAVDALNNWLPPGGQLPLLVRFADSPEEKARKLAKKDRLGVRLAGYAGYEAVAHGLMKAGGSAGAGGAPLPAGFQAFHASGLPDAGTLANQQAAAAAAAAVALGLYGGDQAAGSSSGGAYNGGLSGYGGASQNGYRHHLPHSGSSSGIATPPRLHSGPGGTPLSSSLYIKNLPPEADKLYLYERFAPHGAVLSVKVLVDDTTGKCRGVGFVNYAEHSAALMAINGLHGTKVGDKLLHVSLQTHRMRLA